MEKYKNDPTDDFETEFDSTDLWDCLEHAKKYNDFEPLGFALNLHKKKIAEAKEELELLRDTAHAGGRLKFYEIKLNKILKILK